MKGKKCILYIFSIFLLTTTIYSSEETILWDFGLGIKPYKEIALKKTTPPLSKTLIDSPQKNMALITNPFVPPTLIPLNDKISDVSTSPSIINEISLINIQEVKLLVGRLTMKINYQSIIDIINQIDLNQLDDDDYSDLNYWLANALYNTGKFIKAENIILKNLIFKTEDRFHFLLAMIYESQGRMKDAQKEYLKFVKQYPKSDYKVTALIKARMLTPY